MTVSLISGFLAGVLGAMGMGGGGVLLIFLTAFASVEQLTAQGMNLLFFLPVGLLAVITYAVKKQIEWKTVLLMWAGGIVGAVVGYFCAGYIGSRYLSRLFASFLIIFGISQFLGKDKTKEQKDVE